MEECHTHSGELSSQTQGLHDYILEEVDTLLHTGKHLSISDSFIRLSITSILCLLGLSPPDVLAELRAKFTREKNLTMLSLLPDDPSKIRHRKLTLIKHTNKQQQDNNSLMKPHGVSDSVPDRAQSDMEKATEKVSYL